MDNKKEIMISLRISKSQYITLLETLVKEQKSKSQFLRESLSKYLQDFNLKSCRKEEETDFVDEICHK